MGGEDFLDAFFHGVHYYPVWGAVDMMEAMSVASSMVILLRPGEPENPQLRLTVQQYHAMIEDGIVQEGAPFELIDGRIVCKNQAAAGDDPISIGDRHIWCVTKLGKLSAQLELLGCYMRTRQPISLPPYNEPEPDGAIAIGDEDDYLDHKPTAKEILCVIEVADSSLAYDQIVKGRIYVKAGLPLYVLLNLPEECVEVYRNPNRRRGAYAPAEILTIADMLSLPTGVKGKMVTVPLKRLLPPA
jgi:Uma2 family endonuclease